MPRRWHQALEKQASQGRRWQESPVTEESAKETVKTIARGMPGVSGVTVVTNLRAFYLCTQGCGRIGRPAFPAPSIRKGGMFKSKTRAHRAARMRSYGCELGLFEIRILESMACERASITRRPGIRRDDARLVPLRPCPLERKAAHRADPHFAGNAVARNLAGEVEGQRHRIGDGNLPGDVVAIDLAVEDLRGISFSGHRPRQRGAGTLQRQRCVAIAHRCAHGDVPGSVHGHSRISSFELRKTGMVLGAAQASGGGIAHLAADAQWRDLRLFCGLHARLRTHRAPGIPCALRYFGANDYCKPRARRAARSRSSVCKRCGCLKFESERVRGMRTSAKSRVVPANAGTHNHRHLLERKPLANVPNVRSRRPDERNCAHAGVPACAGTTWGRTPSYDPPSFCPAFAVFAIRRAITRQ